MSKQKQIQIAAPCMGKEEWDALREPIDTGWLTQGPKVAAFEKAFAERHGVKYALATTSCTTALHLALLAVGVQPGDAVVVPSFTWVATANVVEYCGGIPVFCDIAPETFNIDPESARAAIKDTMAKGVRVKAIIPVHLFGLYADMDEIMNLAREYDLRVIEDAACASGASYKGKCAGSIGDVGCYSFHPRKVLVTGEGGMCATNDPQLAEIINCLRNHGASISEEQRHGNNAPYLMPDFNLLGYNYRMTDLQGAIGLVQLEKVDGFIREREKWAQYYDRELSSITWLRTPSKPEGCVHSWQAYVCWVDETKAPLTRDDLLKYLFENGISSRVGTQAVHMLGYYKQKYGLSDDLCPNSRDAYRYSIALPLHNKMSEEDYNHVLETLRRL
ncbi:MAG: DegT/DnrJ/EryC1/StrS family aminotransferase [Peptococcaceae bacterium]|jgi:dTDP-4-amino-4,6-dideoxygalactose transaminase|nr:DegT/DnrJ/EryC1/StrS family aminotransferase [Peptococcaceae bacterium]